ncbi:hypothetical protein Pint_35734 [Pistacia integerrima]|uniref:Uncharacterized protein n=1 Tax=Pistacia integerrima TaxID=434235 RepID=A0ACC0XZS1_9ROSI|nr:hypothetical protein Pint_35734 [Pistacia integerrima]
MNQSKPIFISCFVIFVLLFSLTSVSTQEVEDEREFDYAGGGEKGPGHWGDLKEEWSTCKKGTMQSPIDMSSERVKVILKSGDLKRSYKPCKATLKNRGHDISLTYDWYDLELHMVHTSIDPNVTNKITVIGLLYKIGPPDPFLSKLINNITSMADQLQERDMGMIHPYEIKMGGRKYYRYIGSLTVPPCTEGVNWIINKLIRTVSEDQIKALRIAVHDYAEMNARPLQPINRRGIELYGPNPMAN